MIKERLTANKTKNPRRMTTKPKGMKEERNQMLTNKKLPISSKQLYACRRGHARSNRQLRFTTAIVGNKLHQSADQEN